MNKNVESHSLNSFFTIRLSCYFFLLSLYVWAFSYASKRNSLSYFNYRSIFSLTSLASKFRYLVAQYVLCSNSTGKWHDFPYMTQKGDVPISVLHMLLYAQAASSNCILQSLHKLFTVFFSMDWLSQLFFWFVDGKAFWLCKSHYISSKPFPSSSYKNVSLRHWLMLIMYQNE